MATKTEERMKQMFREYLTERNNDIYKNTIEHSTAIFLWGVLIGVTLAYTYLAPLFIGTLIGFSVAKKDIPIVNYLITKALRMINRSADTLQGAGDRVLELRED